MPVLPAPKPPVNIKRAPTKVVANVSGSQRYECQHCHRTYTPKPKERGYELALRKMALRMYVEAGNFRRIGRLPEVIISPSSTGWRPLLPAPPTLCQRLQEAKREAKVDMLELDELYTFIKKAL